MRNKTSCKTYPGIAKTKKIFKTVIALPFSSKERLALYKKKLETFVKQ